MNPGPGFTPPRFGTDGIRGPAGKPPMDRETMRRLGAALGLWLQREGNDHKRVLVGHDGRASATWIQDCLASGLTAVDVQAASIGLTTTPALSWTVRHDNFDAGVMVSASHNPAHDNGVKIFQRNGSKLPDDVEQELSELTARVEVPEDHEARCKDLHGLLEHYMNGLADRFPGLDLNGKRIAVDAAHGGGSELAPAVLKAFGAEVLAHACAPDGRNINEGVGALHPERLAEVVRAEKAHLGLCLDGDGDRGILVDSDGNVRDGDDILALFGAGLHAQGRLPGDAVVATVMSNLGLHKSLEKAGVGVVVTPVGDRHVMQAMHAGGYALGGEQSGHILFEHEGHFAGDGLVTALMVLALPEVQAQGSATAFQVFHRYPQLLLNVRVEDKPDLDTVPQVAAARDAAVAELGDDGRVLLRYSGTEALCRVMVEGADRNQVERLAEAIATAVRETIGSGD